MPEPLLPRPLEPGAFRAVAANYATGIAIITTLVAGEHHAMTANSFTTVSLSPLLVCVCVQHGTRFHEAVSATGQWAASFLSAAQTPLARWFATTGRPLTDQFQGIPTFPTANGCLILSEGLAAVAASTVQCVTAGDHDVLIGEVTALHGRADGPPDRCTAPPMARPGPDDIPTVYFRSAYGHWLRGDPPAPNI